MKKLLLTTICAFSFFTLAFTLACQPKVNAAEAIGEIISVKHSGWATRSNDSVKKTVKEGDLVYPGDILDVKHGNTIQVKLDEDSENIIYVEGNSVLQFDENGNHLLNLKKGSVFSVLDNLNPGSNFKIATPTAISTVRGTYFKVQTDPQSTTTTVYEGLVKVSGKHKNGRSMRSAVEVSAGYKTKVSGLGQKPVKSQKISKAEFDQINAIIKAIGGNRPTLDYYETLNGSSKKSDGLDQANSEVVTAENEAGSERTLEDAIDSGLVIF